MTPPRSDARVSVGISPRFLTLLTEGGLAGQRILDVGCGWGRLALAVAPLAGRVIGIDRDAAAIAEAERRARAAHHSNVEFHVGDAEREEYARWAPTLVTAHLCVADSIVERAGRALATGGVLGMVAFHVDQWCETEKVSRFAYDEARLESVLRAAAFKPEVIEVEREVKHFSSVEEGLAAAVGLEDRWKTDGRWYRYIAFLEGGGRTLTRSHVIVKARKS